MMPQRCILHVHLINTTRKTSEIFSLSNKERKTLSIWYVWNCCCIVLNNILWHFLALRSSASVAEWFLWACASACVCSPDSYTLYWWFLKHCLQVGRYIAFVWCIIVLVLVLTPASLRQHHTKRLTFRNILHWWRQNVVVVLLWPILQHSFPHLENNSNNNK